MKKPVIHIGCSSFDNWYWQNIFYPPDLPRASWFEYYCEHFKTYELNVTFYKFPTVRTLQTWYRKSPYDFLYSVKAPKLITHIKKFEDCNDEIAKFYQVVREGLREKLACILFQLPPSFTYSIENLERILFYMDSSFKNVIEFRHKSWWKKEVFDAFRNQGVAFCSVSYPGLPEDIILTTNFTFIRLHGDEELFYSGYDSGKLQKLYRNVMGQKNTDEIFIYFNNTAGAEGILNAMLMKEIHVE